MQEILDKLNESCGSCSIHHIQNCSIFCIKCQVHIMREVVIQDIMQKEKSHSDSAK